MLRSFHLNRNIAMSNTLSASLDSFGTPLRALVVGGTAGIGTKAIFKLSNFIMNIIRTGLGVARQVATKIDAHVTIAGRNASKGSEICSEAEHKNIYFKRIDASLMKDVKRFCKEFATESTGPLNLLVLSQGQISARWKSTLEGIDENLALNYYSRMLIIRELRDSNTLAPDAIVISVLNSKMGDPTGRTVLWNDMDCYTTLHSSLPALNIVKVLKHHCSIEDIMLRSLSVGSKRTIIHSFPGHVRTGLLQNSTFPGWLKWTMNLLASTGRSVSPEFCGEKMLIGAIAAWKQTADDGQNFSFMDDLGIEIKKSDTPEDVMQRVAEHTWRWVDQASEGGIQREGKAS